MTSADEIIEGFLEHRYDPIYAREYYLRTRKLKGRKAGIKRLPEAETRGRMTQSQHEAEWLRATKASKKRYGKLMNRIIQAHKRLDKMAPERAAPLLKKLRAAQAQLIAARNAELAREQKNAPERFR